MFGLTTFFGHHQDSKSVRLGLILSYFIAGVGGVVGRCGGVVVPV